MREGVNGGYPKIFKGSDVWPSGVPNSFYVAIRWPSLACGCLDCQKIAGNAYGPFDTEDIARDFLQSYGVTGPTGG